MISSYLSVDLDYWANKHSDIIDLKKAKRFLIKVRNLDKPIFWHTYHHEILEDLNNKRVDRLYQIDYHSDIVYEPISELDFNEGTWGNFYKWKKDCIFEWRYPSQDECFNQGYGRCEWVGESDGPESWEPDRMGYKRVIRKENIYDLNWDSITHVGVCLSPNWCIPEIYDVCSQVFGNKKLFREAKKII